MSDLAPQPAKSGQASKNQLILVIALGAALLIALVMFVVKPFGGSDSGSSDSSAPEVTTPATSDGSPSAAPSAPSPEASPPALPPPPGRGRDPFATLR